MTDRPKIYWLTISLDIEATDLADARATARTSIAKLGFVGARVVEVAPRRMVDVSGPGHVHQGSDCPHCDKDDSHSPQGRN